MSVSPINSASPAPLRGQDPASYQPAGANDDTQHAADRVEISDAAKAQAATAATVMPNAKYWTPNLSPGQRGYVSQPLTALFDKDGKAIKSSPAPGSQIDTQA